MNNELRISHVDVNGMVAAFGIDECFPTFHYVPQSSVNNKEITAYQVVVGDEAGRVVWDSGKNTSKGTPYVQYAGTTLKPKTGYSVQIRLWDEKDVETEYSDPVTFETGLLGSEWQGKWIEPLQDTAQQEKNLSFFEMLVPNPEFWGGEARLKPCQNLRKNFDCTKDIKKARIYASAHGVYELNVNGQPISSKRLAPETSVYDKILYYQTYDITPLLTHGENVLGVTLADGWWIGRLGLSGDSCNYGDKLGFIMQMELTFADGSVEVIGSDETFACHEDMIRYSDLYIGEKHDFGYEMPGWHMPGFEAVGWANCSVANYVTNNLIGQMVDRIDTVEEIEPIKCMVTPKGEMVFDFGQVLSGVCRFEIEAQKGDILTFEHGEVLDHAGNYKNNILGRNKDQKDVLICKEGLQVFEPKFTYHGFRYVKVTGIAKEYIKGKAIVLGTPLKKTGTFISSDEKLNQLQHNIEWSTIGNMCSVPTDCPQREKLGWTGDIQVFAKTGFFNYDLKRFLEVWLTNLRADQYENGEVPVTVPNHPKQDKTQRMLSAGSNSSSGWGDACVLVPYDHYQNYGDVSVLRDNFQAMEKWLGYIQEKAAIQPEGYEQFDDNQKARNPYLWTKGYHFGDWLIPSLRLLPNGVSLGTEKTAAVVGASFYAITVEAFIKVCEALGEEEKTKSYTELLKNIRNAICEEFIAEDGTVDNSDLQGLYVMVLRAGAANGDLKEKVLKKLVTLIEQNNHCLDTGFSSVSYLLDVLYENGYQETAYKLLYQTKAPSWLYMVENGATTMWENWRAITEDGQVTDSSYNHYALGCVGDWMYRNLGGIKLKKAGFKEVEISPDFNCGLTQCYTAVETCNGLLVVQWQKAEEQISMEVVVPIGTTAEVVIGSDRHWVKAGTYRYTKGL